MMGVFGNAGMGCSCASLVINIISIALPYWLYAEGTSLKSYSGLWTSCTELTIPGYENSACVSIGTDFVPDYLQATRALEIIGLLLVAGAGIIGAFKLFVMKENELFPIIAGGLAIAAGTFMIVGAIIYAAKTNVSEIEGATLHAGFALAIVSGVIALASGGLFIAGKSN